jgi:murein DD-endopeptidase MepM/ murein hydrolase activator NlpD
MMRGIGIAAVMIVLPACIPSIDAPLPRAGSAPPTPRMSRGDAPAMQLPPVGDEVRDDTTAFYAPNRQAPATPTPVVALSAPRPAWEAARVDADAWTIAEGSYVVEPGDTLNRIGDRTGAAVEAIARANGIDPPYPVRVAQRLRIPGGRYHLVRGGQTGIAIARAYGVEWSRIVTANALAEPYTLRVGQRLTIPGLALGSSRAAERAAAFTLDVEDLVTGAQPAQLASAATARPTRTARRVLPATTPIVAPARLAGGFLWPVDGRVVKRFGAGASGERSDGIKIAVPLDTPVKSVADGVVAYVGDGIAALGGLIIVKHGDGWTSVYGHAAKLLVRRGQSVRRGQRIALSGETGFADRPEVHFELRKGRTAVDPLAQLPKT